MRLARRRAGWALTAAGTFGLTVAAATQVFVDEAVAVTPSPVNVTAALDSGLARLIEIRVELAWLADPQTFPYELAARATGATLEVGGQAPNGAVRDHALQIAREQSGLPVVDRLLIQPGAGNPSIRMGDANLCHAAGEALSRMLAGHNEPFQVSADPSGQVTLLGTVPSCEEKLRISRRMSQLPGCTSVLNSMVVARAIHEGQIYTPVSADGTSLVAGDPLDLLPPPAALAPTQGQQVVVQNPSQQMTSEAMSFPTTTGGTVSRLRPLPPQQMQTVQAAVPANFAAPNAPAMAQPATYPMVAAARPVSPYQGCVSSAPYQYAVQASAAGNSYGAQQVVFVQTNPLQTGMTNAPMVAQQPARANPYAATATPILLVAATQTDNRFSDNRMPAAGARAAGTPAKNAGGAPARQPQTREAERPAEQVRPLTPNQVHIKRLIEVTCGDAAQDVDMKAMGENRLSIALRVRSAGEGQRLGERILMMPELEPYKVDLAMEVKQ